MKTIGKLLEQFIILNKMGYNDIGEIAQLRNKEFLQKIKDVKASICDFYNKEIAKCPKDKDLRKTKRNWLILINDFRKNNMPAKLKRRLKLEEIEKCKLTLFFSLRKDLEFLNDYFKENTHSKKAENVCEELAIRYKLDENIVFLKNNNLRAKQYSEFYLRAIYSWINNYVEYLYSPIKLDFECIDELLLKNGIFLETNEEKKK